MDIFINTAAALVISIVTALITVQLSVRRFYTERWWDRKIETYSSIFEELYKLKNYSDQKHEDDLGKITLTNADASRLTEQLRKSSDEINKAIEIGSFTISDESIKCLTRFRQRLRPRFEDNPHFELVELSKAESEFLTECINELKSLAAKDLKRKS